MKKFGTNYGGFILPKNLKGLNSNSIIYGVGVGEDISFDILIGKQTDAHIYLFDPTPRAIIHVDLIKKSFDNNIKPKYDIKHGGGDKNYWNLLFQHKISSSKIHMNNFGLFTDNKNLNFYKPLNPNYVSHSLDHTMRNVRKNEFIEVPVKNLKTIMKDLNHDHIDLLKIDIEGVELEVLNQMLDQKIFPKYLCVDFDKRRANRDKNKFDELLIRLKSLNYSIINNNNFDISFQLNIT